MCGRFTLTANQQVIDERFRVELPSEWYPRYNIAPAQNVPIITNANPDKAMLAKWGLVPFWAQSADIGYKMINARSETLASKPAWRAPFKSRRCLIPADGFYEWAKQEKTKQPYFIHLEGRKPFAFAGLWDVWTDKSTGLELTTFTIITTCANDLMKPIHDRMPVILPQENELLWLQRPEPKMLVPYPAELMAADRVGSLCNSPKVDSPDCLLPVG